MKPVRKYDPRAVAAIDAMWKTRPLRPPPLRIEPRTRTAGELALESDRRAGIVDCDYMYTHGGLHE
jgi:hypothetical protein